MNYPTMTIAKLGYCHNCASFPMGMHTDPCPEKTPVTFHTKHTNLGGETFHLDYCSKECRDEFIGDSSEQERENNLAEASGEYQNYAPRGDH